MTNAEKYYNTMQSLHTAPAPFNPEYKPELVKMHKQYQKELRDYQDTIDDSVSNKIFDAKANNYNRYLQKTKYSALFSHCDWFNCVTYNREFI